MVVQFGKAAGLFALALAVEGAKYRREGSRSFAGVPVLNYRADVNEWMILFRDGTTDQSMLGWCDGKCHLMGHPDAGGAAFVKVQSSEQEIEKMVSKNPSLMDLVEPDETEYMIPEIEVDDTDKMASAAASWGLERIGVPSRPSSGSGVHVYVTDTGIRGSHKDFGGRVIPTIDLNSNSVVECKGDATCANDLAGHGTHCAGTVGGNTFGVASGVTLHAVKTLTDWGSGPRSWQLSAIDWVTTSGHKPAVLSMSLGGGSPDPIYTASIGAATKAGVTVVVAAGNKNSDSCSASPAFVATAITVGATDSRNRRASYSNYGSCNDIMAPGSAIISASQKSDTESAPLTGTSMACPHVSGAAALLIESGVDSRDAILASMQATGIVGLIKGLRRGDPDLFLWVGSDAAPSPAPTPKPITCPEFARYLYPNSKGDCLCNKVWTCSRDTGDKKVANCPWSGGIGRRGGRYFSPSCEDCICYPQWY